MEFGVVAAVLVIGLLVLLAVGVPVAFAMLLTGVLGLWIGSGSQGLQFMGVVLWNKTATYEFLAAPLFIYMGFLLTESGMVPAMFRMITNWLGRLPGSLGIVTMVGSAVFASMSGSASATAATLGTVMGPEVRRYGYSTRFISGIINGGASLDPLIPPSVAMIIYSTLTETPLSHLFAAGVVPGLMFFGLQSAYIMLAATVKPHWAPRTERISWRERFVSLRVAPVVGFVVFVVLGGIFLGWFTPTESAAIGVVLAMVILSLYKRLRPSEIVSAVWRGSRGAGVAAVFVMTLIVAGSVYSDVLNFAGVPQYLSEQIRAVSLDRIEFLILLSVLLFVMGMFLNAVSIQLIIVPFAFPLLSTVGIDPVWFGVFLVTWIEIGTMTPPYGLDFFILQGTMGISYKDALLGALPFIPIWFLGLALLVAFPDLALWLPSRLF